MTELNQRASSVVKAVIERQETIQVTKHGRVVLRIVPESFYTEQDDTCEGGRSV